MFREILEEYKNSLDVDLDNNQIELLVRYCELLIKWNKVYNLTAIRNPKDIIIKNILDSLVIAPYLAGDDIIDVGTGAGLPGIPLSILFKDKQFVLLDSNGKKTRFLNEVKSKLGLDNIEIICSRVEEYRNKKFDVILSRAYADLAKMLNQTQHLLNQNGQFLAMKGNNPQEELAELPEQFKLCAITPLTVPGLNAERHVVVLNLK